MTDYSQTTNAIGDFIRSLGLHPILTQGILVVFSIVGVLTALFGAALIFVYMERKVSAFIQHRLGPMRVGPWGLLQAFADVIKLFFKEVLATKGSDKLVFYLAPALPLSAAILVLSVIPFQHNLQVANPDMGIPYIIAISGIGTLGILIGGWASNNKFSLLGSLRSGSQMVSYEISLALILLFIVLVSGTTNLRDLVLSQQGHIWDWWVFKSPVLGLIAFLMFQISSTAELNRGPFDIAEAEQELTAGYYTEYSGTAFAMFFLAEYGNLLASTSLATVCFLGGFLPPAIGVPSVDHVLHMVPGLVWFLAKVFFLVMLSMWYRWTFPRPRVDQLITLEWKWLLPANLVLLVLGAVSVSLGWILP